MTSYLPLMNFLPNAIQALKHRWKKSMDRQVEYVEK